MAVSKFWPIEVLVTEIPPEGAMELTFTLEVVSAMLGRALACIVVDPDPTAVTGTAALVAFAGIVTLEGTVATVGLLELKLMVKPPAGAGDDKVNVRFWTVPVVRDRLTGVKLAVRPTTTVWLTDE
jgi:hypothetical protein